MIDVQLVSNWKELGKAYVSTKTISLEKSLAGTQFHAAPVSHVPIKA